MAPLLDDGPVVHHQDGVRPADGGEAVGDDEAGAILHQLGHGLLDEHLGAGVDRTGGLVEDEDLRVGQEGPRDGEQLLLPLGDVGGVVVHDGLVAVGQGVDEMVGSRRPGGRLHLLIGGPLPAVGDVLPDGAAEQPRVLEDHPEQPAKAAAGHLPGVHPVDGDAPPVDLVEAQQQVDQRRLAGPVRPDDGHGLSRRHLQVEVLDERGLGQVAEGDIVQRDVPLGGADDGRGARVGLLLRLVEYLEDPLGRGCCRLQHIGDGRRLGDRLGELAGVLDERLDVAQGESPLRHPQATHDRDGHVVQVGDEHHGRVDDPGDELGLEARLVQQIVLMLEALDGGLPAAEHLDDGVAGEHLLDVSVHLSGVRPLGGELALGAAGDQHCHHHCQGNCPQGDQGQ